MGYYTCFYCGHFGNESSHHEDHAIPRSWGAPGGPSRTVDACDQCNLAKGSKDPISFAAWVVQTAWRPSWSDQKIEAFIWRVMADHGLSWDELMTRPTVDAAWVDYVLANSRDRDW